MKTITLKRLVAGILAAVVAVSSGSADHSRSEPGQTSVTTGHPERRTLTWTIEQPGQIEGLEQTPVSARIGGHVQNLHADIGDPVKKGQVLAELGVPEMVEEHGQKKAAVMQAKAEVMQAGRMVKAAEAGLKKAEAAIEVATAAHQRAEAGLARWKAQYQRESRLAASRSVEQQTLEQTIDHLRAAEAAKAEAAASVKAAEAARDESGVQLEKAHGDVTLAEARLEGARADERRLAALLGYAQVTAPFDGVVTKRSVATGQLVTAGGPPLFVVVRTGPLSIFVDVPETDAPFVRVGLSARVVVPALAEREFDATVTRTGWALEAQAKTLRVQIDLSNPDGLLRPGMSAIAHITVERPDVLTVPASAILRRDEKSFVVCVTDGVAHLTQVKLGQRQGKVVEVLKKQSHGDGRRTWEDFDGTEEVVQSNSAALADGQAVRVEPASLRP